MMTRRKFLGLAAMGAGCAAGVGLYTWRVEPHWLQIVRRRLPVLHLPDALAGCTLAHVSDLHIGPRVDDAYLLRCFERLMALAPEIVVYTGDFTSFAADVFAHAARMFSHLPHGRLATLGILGNHDYGPGWSHPEIAARLAELASAAGVRILRNEVTDVEGLQVAGLDDLWAHRFDAASTLAALQPGRAAVALCHNPDTADLPVWGAYRGWILAGHTHGGQCKPPFLPPPLLPVLNPRYTAGEFPLADGRRMYISRGVGHLWHVRFNVRPEITVFTLERA